MSVLSDDVKAYCKVLDYIKQKFELYTICSNVDKWIDTVEKNYNVNKKQVFLLCGDYEHELEILKNKPNAIFVRQSLLLSKKLPNEVLIPSSYGCVAGDINMDICKITEKPKISFCGMKSTHFTREQTINILMKSDKIESNFIFTQTPCCGSVDVDIENKKKIFNTCMVNSEFVFCPRGNGNFSIRFYEALKSGRIPVVYESDNIMPFNKIVIWNEICVVTTINTIEQDIVNFHKNNDLIEIQQKCKKIYKQLFIDNFADYLFNDILLCEKEIQNI